MIGGLLVLALVVVLGPAGWTRWRSGDRIRTIADVPEIPVALVFGAQVNPDGSPSTYLRGRLQVALELFRAGKVRAILVSGDNGTVHYNEPDNMKRWLVAQGVPEVKVVTDYAGFDTYDSCVRAQRIFGVNRLIAVTQTYHLYRALATCRQVGIDAWGVGDDSVRTRYPDTWRAGEVRELAANLKMAWDLVTRRTPTLGPHEDGIDKALAAG